MAIKNLLKKKRDAEFYFFSGKGGVGKTSISAATSLYFSKQGKKTLVISVDPAHSLGDSFRVKIGPKVKKIAKNLFAVEIDPETSVQEYKEKLTPKIENMDMLKDLGIGDLFDVAGNTPGIDEMAAFDKFLQYMNSDEYDVIIFDTAPTGHALRFLSLPDILDSWIGKMIKIKMKFSGVIGMFKKIMPFGDEKDEKVGTEELDAIKDRIEKARVILADSKRTHFNLVLIPEQLSIVESERSMKTLKEYNINVESVIVNQLIPKNDSCRFCSRKRSIQQQRLKTIANKFKNQKILKLKLFVDEVNGIKMLESVAKELYGK